MTFDENIKRAESIISQLESAEAISMETYRRLASEATELLKQCRAEIEATKL